MNPPTEMLGGDSHPPSSQSSSSSESDPAVGAVAEDEDFFQLRPNERRAPPIPSRRSNRKPPPAPPPPALSPAGRYDVPDPNRIPMSVFARNSSPKDWSVASNESLFSIQIGNSSFSREHGMYLIGKSGELGGKARLLNVDEAAEEEEEAIDAEKPTGGDATPQSASRTSDCSSNTSFGSFAFPVLASDGKCDSIKAMPKPSVEYQPPLVINSMNAPTTRLAAPAPPPLPPPKRRWFSCFSGCQMCS